MKNDMNHDTPRMYASIPIGSTIVVQCEDGGPWTHGTVEIKGDHNHNDRSYTIWVTRTGWLITSNSKHVKPTQITAKQYLWDQLAKHIVTDPLKDILKQLKNKHMIHTNTPSKQLKNTQHGTHTSNTLHESMTINNGEDITQKEKRKWTMDKRTVLKMCHFTKMLRKIVRGVARYGRIV